MSERGNKSTDQQWDADTYLNISLLHRGMNNTVHDDTAEARMRCLTVDLLTVRRLIEMDDSTISQLQEKINGDTTYSHHFGQLLHEQ